MARYGKSKAFGWFGLKPGMALGELPCFFESVPHLEVEYLRWCLYSTREVELASRKVKLSCRTVSSYLLKWTG